MSVKYEELRGQLTRLVEVRCVDPLEILLQEPQSVRQRVHAAAGEWAEELLTADDERAIGMVMRLVAALYPSDTTFDPPVDWWRTPMGQVVAMRVGHPTATRVSYPVAGAMLGISKQGVHDLVTRGKLDRHPDGGVVPASIRDRIRKTAGERT